MAKKFRKGGRYASEIERLRELNAINEVLKKGEIENAALLNTSKESEIVSDNALDNMLEQLNLNRNSGKDLEIIEGMSAEKARIRRTLIQNAGRRAQRPRRAAPKISRKKASRPRGKQKSSRPKGGSHRRNSRRR